MLNRNEYNTEKLYTYLLSLFEGELYKNQRVSIQDLKQLKSGWAGDIYSFSIFIDDNIISTNLVLKVYSASETGILNIKKESQALMSLHNDGFPVPELLFFDTSLKYLGRPFVIMYELEGDSLWDVYTAADEDKKKEIIKIFASLLYSLHSINVKTLMPNYNTKNGLSLITDELEEIKIIIDKFNFSNLLPIYKWLVTNVSSIKNLKPSILHRDYHPWNVIGDNLNNTSYYVIDWVWSIGDYRFDLAWTITLMERSGFKTFAEETFNEYELLFNSKIYNFDYFKVLATLRWLLNVTTSLKSGDNLREGTKADFENFLKQPIKNAMNMFKKITGIQI